MATALPRRPQLVILLDVLMLWVLVLLIQPHGESREAPEVAYRFDALPQGTEIFDVDAAAGTWRRFDVGEQRWVTHGPQPDQLFTIRCHDQDRAACMALLPRLARRSVYGALVFGLPAHLEAESGRLYLQACAQQKVCRVALVFGETQLRVEVW